MLQEVAMKIEDMKCAGCEGTVRKKLLTVKGVYEARANFKSGAVLLNVSSSFQSSEAVKAIRELGYTPVKPTE
ncbi:MAG: heavy-metal-associated domain-containing protein [Mariprofundaceae bacterium]|nr:heavy-metal-associated domain-containing protein [Mariprofundaceae bacterium]